MSNWLRNADPVSDLGPGNFVRLWRTSGFTYQLRCQVISTEGSSIFKLRVIALFTEEGGEITGGEFFDEYQDKELLISRDNIFPAL